MLKKLNANLLASINQGIKVKQKDPWARFRIETNINDSKVRLYIIRDGKIVTVYQFEDDEKMSVMTPAEERNN